MSLKVGAQGVGNGEIEELKDFDDVEEEVRKAYEELTGDPKEEVSEEDTDTPDSGESAVDGEEVQGGDTKAEGEGGEEPKAIAKGEAKEEEDKETKPIDPPNDWDAEAKEWFKSQPRVVQAQNKRISEQFASWRKQQLTKIKEREAELDEYLPQVKGAAEVVSRWLPIWGVKGVTPEQAITQLCTFNHQIIHEPEKAIELIAAKAKLKVQIEGGKTTPQPQAQTFDLSTVTNHVKNEIKSESEQQALLRQQAEVAERFDSAFTSLVEETNDQGKYVYPDLHNLDFQAELEPLAIGIARANPKLAEREVLLRAYKAAGGRVIPKTIPATAKLNASASTSARRANSSSPGSYARSQSVDLEPRPGESVEETVARAYSLLTSR